MKKFFAWIAKAAAAGLLALALMSCFCLIYYNPGIHVENPTGVTDYIWENRFQSLMTEGAAWNIVDENGFFNTSAVDHNMDVLVMGSSHMEGMHLFAKQNIPHLLGQFTGLSVYNIGTSGHRLPVCVQNLEAALSVMEPTGYVIIETNPLVFTQKEIDQCIAGEYPEIPSYNGGILYHLQKIPYLKLLYNQFKSMREATADTKKTEPVQQTLPEDAYEQLAQYIRRVCDAHQVQPVILHHPTLDLMEDGSCFAVRDAAALELMKEVCSENGIVFVDMAEDFLELYRNEHRMPHGFSNTTVGSGHMNAYGAEAAAQRLAREILDMEANAEEVTP